jgi:hypothetical protein
MDYASLNAAAKAAAEARRSALQEQIKEMKARLGAGGGYDAGAAAATPHGGYAASPHHGYASSPHAPPPGFVALPPGYGMPYGPAAVYASPSRYGPRECAARRAGVAPPPLTLSAPRRDPCRPQPLPATARARA